MMYNFLRHFAKSIPNIEKICLSAINEIIPTSAVSLVQYSN